MKPLATRTLYLALVAVYLSVSSVAAEPKRQYGGFSPHPDSLQVNIDYLRSLEMTKVKASPELQQAVKAIPVEPGTPITPEQEADLRDWLYDFLVAFSVSGSDSLAAAFYLREGVNNPDALEKMKKGLESRGLLKGDTPFDLFQAKADSLQGFYDYIHGQEMMKVEAVMNCGRPSRPSLSCRGLFQPWRTAELSVRHHVIHPYPNVGERS